MEYQLIRSKRKTIAIYVKEDGSVEVRAPKWVSERELQRWILEKSDWIRKKKQEAADKNCVRQKYYTEGAVFQCLDKEYRLHIVESSRNAVYVQEREGSRIIVKTRSFDEAYVRALLIKWSAEQLKRSVLEKVEWYLPRLEEFAEGAKACVMREITGITIKNVKTRWGSCSVKGHLNFSVKLSMAPAEIIDYVIVHELCHLLYMDHSPKFWGAVRAVLPDYEKRRRYLKKNGWKYEF